jgi:hypothetical protein
MAVARKKNDAGVAALIEQPEPVSIQEITMLDWYASFALADLPISLGPERRAAEAFQIGLAMLKEREKYL